MTGDRREGTNANDGPIFLFGYIQKSKVYFLAVQANFISNHVAESSPSATGLVELRLLETNGLCNRRAGFSQFYPFLVEKEIHCSHRRIKNYLHCGECNVLLLSDGVMHRGALRHTFHNDTQRNETQPRRWMTTPTVTNESAAIPSPAVLQQGNKGF